MKLAPRDSLDVDRRIPVTAIRDQLLFKTQNNFFRENLTMDNSLREKRHQQDGCSCKKLKVENKLLYRNWSVFRFVCLHLHSSRRAAATAKFQHNLLIVRFYVKAFEQLQV